MSDYANGGLESRYTIVKKSTGEQVDDNHYFVLNWKKDPHARKALMRYAISVAEENVELSKDIVKALAGIEETDKL